MHVGSYLFQRLKEAGVTHTFGLPGDFALSLYAAQETAGMPTLVMTHEPSAGYAADVYARLKGLGVAIVTYGVGALNMVNATAMAYAEQSPLLVIAGAPEAQWREADVLFYHRVKSPDTQLRVYQEVTAAQACINDASRAAVEIDRVIATVRRLSRPGFIEIARDVVHLPITPPIAVESTLSRLAVEQRRAGLSEALQEIVSRLNDSRKPVVYAGVEIERFGLTDELRQFVERTNLPVATSLMGKAVLPERHPNFIGNYFGRLGPDSVRRYLEGSDCVLALGMLMTAMDTGIYTAQIDRRRLLQITSQGTSISHHDFPEATLPEVLKAMRNVPGLKRHSFTPPRPPQRRRIARGDALTINGIIEELNEFLTPKHIVIADTGDCLFASVELRADWFIGPGYYASMGLAVPGAIGAQVARPDLRPVVLLGDGAFKMNGAEIGTAKDHGLNPILVILNNRTFATLKASAGDRPYFRLRSWDYAAVARALGGQAARARTREEFRNALRLADSSSDPWVIDALIDENDCSPTLRRLGEEAQARAKDGRASSRRRQQSSHAAQRRAPGKRGSGP